MPALRHRRLTDHRLNHHARYALSRADIGWPNEDLSWQDHGRCRQVADPDLFMPEDDDSTRQAAAKLVCQDCPVRTQCLAYALAHQEPFGIWGGTTPRERRALTPIDRRSVGTHDAAIARLTRLGKTAAEIATELAITPRTVLRARARLRATEAIA